MRIGPSTGVYYRILGNERIFETVELIAQSHPDAIELNFGPQLFNLGPDCMRMMPYLKNIPYRSLHAPSPDDCMFGDDEAERYLVIIAKIAHDLDLDTVVVHPDAVADFGVFKDFDIPVAFENMDTQKRFGQTVQEMQSVFEQAPDAGFVLDLQHIYMHDKTMQLTQDFLDAFSDRLVHYHLSGYDPELWHVPLCDTDQEIIASAVSVDVPIILEGAATTMDSAQKELPYVRSLLNRG